MSKPLFQRKSLDQIITVPETLTSVYVVEKHIWAEGGDDSARAARQAEIQTVEEFLIDPVRSFLIDFFRQVSAPYYPKRKDNPIGQGWWVQAEFGSGKSHLLSFLGALVLGNEAAWKIVDVKEQKLFKEKELAGITLGTGKRDNLFSFYDGLKKKNEQG